MTPRLLWAQSVSPESSPAPKRLPEVAAIDSPDKGEDNIARDRSPETPTLNSPDPRQDTRLDSIGPERRVKAFLDTIALAEGTASPDGYRTQYTGTKFVSFQDHPREMRCEPVATAKNSVPTQRGDISFSAPLGTDLPKNLASAISAQKIKI